MSVSPCFDCYWKCPGSQSSNMRSLGSGQIAPYVQSGLIRGNRWLESTVVVDFEPGHGGTRCPAFQVRLLCELLFHLTYDQVSRVPVPTVTVECFWNIALGQNVIHLFIPRPPPSCCKCVVPVKKPSLQGETQASVVVDTNTWLQLHVV